MKTESERFFPPCGWANHWWGIAAMVAWWITYAVVLAMLSGCVSYAKVDKADAAGATCRAVVRGSFFSFTTPAALEECRPDTDR